MRTVDWRKSPCPGEMKGALCEKCDARYVCTQTDRPKPNEVAALRWLQKRLHADTKPQKGGLFCVGAQSLDLRRMAVELAEKQFKAGAS